MKRFVEIEFKSEKQKSNFSLKWELLDETHSLFWFKCLHQLLKKKEPSFYRFTGLNRKTKDLKKLSDELNVIIELINKNTSYYIKQRADGGFSQAFANNIHHDFEMLYGDAHKPSDLFLGSSPLIRGAITKINHIIHDMEALTRTEVDSSANKAIINEFLNRPQFKMNDEFLKHFNLNLDFGDLALHYGIIGKSWWEVFLDEDEDIYDEAIRPLSFMSGEFDIHFSQYHPDQETKSKFDLFLKNRGLDKSDPKLCLGYLCLAKLDLSNKSREKVNEHLEEELTLTSIQLLENENVIVQMSLTDDDMAQHGFFHVRPPEVVSTGKKINLKKTAVQLIPLVSKASETLLQGDIFNRDWDGLDHCICLMGTSDTQRVTFVPSQGQIELGRPVSLGLGEILELAYNAQEDRYLPITSKK